jgi:recombination associated protein RdgC
MFPKTLTTYRILNPEVFAADKLTEEKLAEFGHRPIGQTATVSTGWAPVRDGLYQFRYMNLIRLDFLVEKKSVPASAVKRRVKTLAATWEEQAGHAPGRKVLKELKQTAKEDLLARAVPSDTTTKVWIDLEAATLSIESSSTSVLEAVLSTLYAGQELAVQGLDWPNNQVLTAYASGVNPEHGDECELPDELTADDFMTLEHPGENGKSVAYSRANLSDDDVLRNFELGATVTQLALTWSDKLSFVLNGEAGQLCKIKATDVLKTSDKSQDADAFQNSVFLVGSTIRQLNNFLTTQA